MSNINGKAYAMNAITPMSSLRTWEARLFLGGLSVITPLQQDLTQLSFIHAARWIVIPRDKFPYLGQSQPRESLKYDYLLFMSNFNGTWNEYIDAFASVLSHGLAGIWGASENYPKHGTVTPIKAYIDQVQFPTDYYFSAYPRATANDTKAAHLVQEAFDALSESAAQQTPEQFEQAYLRFILSVQANLGQTGTAPTVL
jgi:hypothetical protein